MSDPREQPEGDRSERGKTIDLEVRIDVPPEAVWKAISDAEELQRWFPLEAAVEPGEGGSITLSWGPGVEGTAPIDVWEEGKRLGWAEEWPGDPEPVRVAVDLRVKGVEGGTVLRLVHSGFRPGDDWDDYIDTLDSGWRYFLFNLRHYLERHRGEPRRMVWDRREIHLSKAEAWERLVSADGLAPLEEEAAAGVAGQLWTGDPAEVVMVSYPIHLALRIPSLGDALLFLELEPGGDAFSLGTWLSLYGDAGTAGAELQASLEERLARLFGAGGPKG